MITLLKELVKLPLPTLLVLIGVALLTVGFGMKLEFHGIDLGKINPFYAKFAGILLFGTGFIIYLLKEFSPEKIDALAPGRRST